MSNRSIAAVLTGGHLVDAVVSGAVIGVIILTGAVLTGAVACLASFFMMLF
jgi:hypothetical protein